MDEVKKNSVLIVDDENSNIMVLTDILSVEYTVYAVKSGEKAIKAAEKYLPDVILLDILMPEMDGYAVISALKNSENTRSIPVIFITGLNSVDDEEKGLTLGAADYIAKPFSPAVVKLRIMNQIKMLDQLHTIERLSMIDQLTDLPNRRNFDIRLNQEWDRALREKKSVSILMMDIDRFKNYNDVHGHQQGDVALKAAANAFKQTLKRPGDFAARWGGEEFAVLLPNTDSHGARDVAEQIRRHVEDMEIPRKDGLKTKVTISIGTKTEVPVRNSSYEGFISGADEALYRAKETGRNKVCTMCVTIPPE